MSGFTKAVTYNTEFEGDEVSMTLSRLTREDMAKFAPYIQIASDGGGKMKFEDSMQMIEFASSVLPNYISNFGGLKDKDGELIDIETVLSQSYFINLVAQMMGKIIEISSPKAEDEKN